MTMVLLRSRLNNTSGSQPGRDDAPPSSDLSHFDIILYFVETMLKIPNLASVDFERAALLS